MDLICQYCKKPRPATVAACPYCKPTAQQIIQNGIDKTAEKIAATVNNSRTEREQKERREQSTTKTCQKCHMNVPATAEICPYCRTRLKTSKTTKTIATGFALIFLISMIPKCFDSPGTSTSTAQVIQPVSRAYVSCTGKYDRVVNYAVLLGRSAACGESIKEPMGYVGGWLDDCFFGSEKSVQLQVFLTGLEFQNKQQKDGRGPDNCSNISNVYASTTWPNNGRATTSSEAAPLPPTIERAPLPNQTDTIPYIDKLSGK